MLNLIKFKAMMDMIMDMDMEGKSEKIFIAYKFYHNFHSRYDQGYSQGG